MNFHRSVQALVVLGLIFLLSACAATPPASPPPSETPSAPEPATGPASEIVVYASDLPAEALTELDFMDDSASPGGKMISLPNNGDELDPPPENDPHITFHVPVQSGVPYRCWVHMKVGEPKGRSTANVVWVQFSDSVDQAGQEIYRPGTGSYLTAQGPTQLGWTWVGCDAADGSDSLVYFQNSGEGTVRIQAGAEGAGVDQLVLSPSAYLNGPPAEPIVPK